MASSEAPAAVEAAGTGRSTRWRSVTAGICVAVAAVLTTPAVVAYWGQRTVNDTQRYVATVGPLVNSPQVQDAIATRVSDAIQKQVDVPSVVNDVFAGVITERPRLQELVGPLSGAIDVLIEDVTHRFVASNAFADLWVTINTKAQQSVVRLLQGDNSGAVSLQNGEVVLDLGDVIDQVKQQLVARGLTFVQNIPIPNVDKQIVLFDAPKLQQLRTIYAFTNPVAIWLIWIVVLLYVAALLLSRRRPRMTAIIGAAVAANGLLLAFGLAVGRQLFVNELAGTVFGPASTVFYDQLLSYLIRGWQVLVWLGLILVGTGWFAGSTASGKGVRTAVAGWLGTAGAAMADSPVGDAGRWVAANARWLRIVVGLLGVIVLFWGVDMSPARIFWSLALVLVLLAVVQVLVGAGAHPRAASEIALPKAAPPEPESPKVLVGAQTTQHQPKPAAHTTTTDIKETGND